MTGKAHAFASTARQIMQRHTEDHARDVNPAYMFFALATAVFFVHKLGAIAQNQGSGLF